MDSFVDSSSLALDITTDEFSSSQTNFRNLNSTAVVDQDDAVNDENDGGGRNSAHVEDLQLSPILKDPPAQRPLRVHDHVNRQLFLSPARASRSLPVVCPDEDEVCTPQKDADLMHTPGTSTPQRRHRAVFSTSLSTSMAVADCSRLSRRNPFDSLLMDSLHGDTFSVSPSVFRCYTPENKDDFWSIEQRAMLNPADITEEEIRASKAWPSPDPQDPTRDARMKSLLDDLWRNGSIYVPSPDAPRPVVVETPQSSCGESPAVRRPQYAPVRESPLVRPAVPFRRHSSHRTLLNTHKKKVCTRQQQTDLTIPPSADIDFASLLGPGFVYSASDADMDTEEGEVEKMNCSSQSLRRRLFADDDEADASMCSERTQDGEEEADEVFPRGGPLADWDDDGPSHSLPQLELSPI